MEVVTFGGETGIGTTWNPNPDMRLFLMTDIESHLAFKSIAQQEVFCILCFVRKIVPNLLSRPVRPTQLSILVLDWSARSHATPQVIAGFGCNGAGAELYLISDNCISSTSLSVPEHLQAPPGELP
jgi:hypothetical protein